MIIKIFLHCLLLFFSGCAFQSHENIAHLSSEKQEILHGETYFLRLIQKHGGKYFTHPEIVDYVQKVGMRLAKVSNKPHLPYQFEIVNFSIPCTWALSGGKVAISRQMLFYLKNEAELAAVLAYELAHSLEKERNMDSTAFPDQLAIKYMVSAGYDPESFIEIMREFLKKHEETLAFKEYFTAHPITNVQLNALKEHLIEYRKGGYLGKQAFEDALERLFQKSRAYHFFSESHLAFKEENCEKALETVDEGIAIEPNEPHLHALKGKILCALERYDDATHAMNKAIELNPHYFDYYLSRGKIYQQIDDRIKARKDFEQAQEFLPTPEGFFYLGKIDYEESSFQKAYVHFQICSYSHCKFSDEAQKYLELLKNTAPSNYRDLLVKVEKTPKKSLKIKVKNQGENIVKNILVRVDFFSPEYDMLVAKEVKFYSELKPGAENSEIAEIGTYHHISEVSALEALVIHAEFDQA